MSYEQKLMAMKKLLKKPDKKKSIEPVKKAKTSPFYEKVWLEAGLEKEVNEHGIVYKRTVIYDKEYMHGTVVLSELGRSIEKWIESDETHPLTPVNMNKLVFFDTETTGLKGVGTLIFLLGFIEQVGSSFMLTQYVLPGPDHEAAFLYASRLWEEKFTLVTYNGKSFDVPQLETRWTMNRKVLPALLSHDHIDLLHSSRRIWKEEVSRFRLSVIEEEKLEFFRDGDIPGHMAPIIYQDAVKNGRAEMLMKVLTHNEWDILSLVALYIHATDIVLGIDKSVTAVTQTNIGKWFSDLKSYDRSKLIFEKVIEDYGLDHPITHFHFANIMKREGKNSEAISSFSVAARNLTGREQLLSLEALAMLYEHKLKELPKALEHTKMALKILENEDELTSRFKIRKEKDFLHREMRLFRKLFPG
ncbi:ribonuclease H-like domain-containing protein [Sporosarcina sp. CAU 1771]